VQGKHFLFVMPGGAGYTECVCNAAGESVGENNRGTWRDTETSFDPTRYHMYGSNQGRWLSPDPLGRDVANPQSLNRYAYVLNNPATLVDPQGLSSCVPGISRFPYLTAADLSPS
jgi:RHS repeat-associated protein